MAPWAPFRKPSAWRVLAWFALGLTLLWVNLVRAQSLESVLAPGKMIQGHAKWEDDCKSCHIWFERSAQDRLCMDCHKDVGADVRAKGGFHGRMKPSAQPPGQLCRSCHTEHKGREARIVELDKKQFDHTLTDFQLRGKHEKTECDKCHLPGKKFRAAALDCNSCHKKDDTHKGSLGPKCADCHTENNWKEAKFDHDTTKFPLTGKHVDTKCAECHKDKSYKNTPLQCYACHKKADDGPKGHKGQYGEKCDTCHNAKGWKPSSFNHDADTKFSLRGKHRATLCTDCHTGPLYKQKLTSDCYSCHKKDDKHKETLGRECSACHTEKNWKETTKFDHSKTKYPLLGKHLDVKCDACHKSKVYNEAPKECIGCHLKDDKHKESLGRDCAACHNEKDWKLVSKFDHAKTKFPLLGKHIDTKCDACHKSKVYNEAAKTCIGCHKKDDKHEATLGEDCTACHIERDWKTTVGRFDHDRSKFKLRNAHAATKVKCSDCHTSDLRAFRKTAGDCYSCHKKNDKHEGQEGPKCETCHTDKDWKVPTFDHAKTRFALLGKHVTTACKECHLTPRYKDAARECYGCHKKDDKHKLVYGVKCESCHNARDWKVWEFDHGKRTSFKLDGAHFKAACKTCHFDAAPTGKAIAAVGTTCMDCHAREDVHDGNFGVRCETCHITANWKTVTNRALRSERAPSKNDLATLVASALGRASHAAQAAEGVALLGASQ